MQVVQRHAVGVESQTLAQIAPSHKAQRLLIQLPVEGGAAYIPSFELRSCFALGYRLQKVGYGGLSNRG